jgi:hypothetical protein
MLQVKLTFSEFQEQSQWPHFLHRVHWNLRSPHLSWENKTVAKYAFSAVIGADRNWSFKFRLWAARQNLLWPGFPGGIWFCSRKPLWWYRKTLAYFEETLLAVVSGRSFLYENKCGNPLLMANWWAKRHTSAADKPKYAASTSTQ